MYPPLDPFATGHLPVGGGHTVYWETSGNPEGKPALYLHGGGIQNCGQTSASLWPPPAGELVVVAQDGHGGTAMVEEVNRAVARFTP